MSDPILITADRVITGLDDDLGTNTAVLVVDGLISAVGATDAIHVPADARRIDLPGSTILPGLVDCHEHLVGRGRFSEGTGDLHEPDAMWGVVVSHHATEVIKTGVTTVRIPGAHHGVDLAVRRAMEEGFLVGPRMICAGQAITMTGGHGCEVGIEVDGPAEAMRATRSQLAAGADFIKVMASGGVGTVRIGEEPSHPELTLEELTAIVQVARFSHKPVTAHADGVEGIENALRAGVSSIEHGIFLTAEQARFMSDNEVALVPTLSTMVNIARKGPEWGLPAEWSRTAEGILQAHRESFLAAVEAGVLYGTGTDGYGDIVDEIVAFVDCGIAPLRAIQAATRDSARIAAPRGNFGTLEPGSSADLLVVTGNPLEDLQCLRSVRLVVSAGMVVHTTPESL